MANRGTASIASVLAIALACGGLSVLFGRRLWQFVVRVGKPLP
jgi:hypothetical protein